MTLNLKTRLTFSYMLIALISVLLISLLMNGFVEKYFREYVQQNQEQKNEEVVTAITTRYQKNDAWDIAAIELIGVRALEGGMIIKVYDHNNQIVWDATTHNNGMCQRIIENMAKTMNRRYPNVSGSYAEVPYPLYHEFDRIGEVKIGQYGPFYMNEFDLAFIDTLNNIMLGVGVFSLLLAFVIGGIMAKRLSRPISRVTNTAQTIATGHLSDRIDSHSNIREIGLLTTTINNLAETLEKQEQFRKRFTHDIAHEFRTPLSTLLSHLDAMIDGVWKPDKRRLQSCQEETLRILKMVADLDKLNRYEDENLALSRETFDISLLLKRLITNFDGEVRKKNIHVKFNNYPQMIYADQDKISQVFVNLLSNAIKYSKKGGTLEITLSETETDVHIDILDNGIGIAENDLPHIFERLYRTDESRNRKTGGAGIGLTIAKTIVDAHRGNIFVKSQPHVGSTFTVVLPKNML